MHSRTWYRWWPGARARAALGALSLALACNGDGDADATAAVQSPVPMPNPAPIEYPLELWDEKVEGETEVLVHVNVMGDVDSARVSKASGYEQFDSAAVAGARQLRFTPGRRGDRPIAMMIRIPVRFSRDATASFGPASAPDVRQ